MPEDEITPPKSAELQQVEAAMQNPDVAHAAGLMLAAWRLYYLARAQMVTVSKGKLHQGNFHNVSVALSKAACEGFKVGVLKNQMKNMVMPFLKKMSMKEVKSENSNDATDPAGDEQVAQQ